MEIEKQTIKIKDEINSYSEIIEEALRIVVEKEY